MEWFESPSGGPRWKGLKPLWEKVPKDRRQEVIDQFCLEYPTWFFEVLTEVDPDKPTVLEEFQIAYLLDDNRLKISNKTRQAGGSLVVSMAKFWKAYKNEGYRCDIVSVNQKEAQGKITYVRNLWESLPRTWRHPLSIDNAFSIGFHEGRRRSVINSIAASAGVRGGRKDVVFDEAAHIPMFEPLFVAALPATIRGGGGFDVVSTPMGNTGKFADIWNNLDGRYTKWGRHGFLWLDVTLFCTDVHAARAKWEGEYEQNMSFMGALFDEFANDDLREIVANLTEEEFHQEFCGVFVDESTAFYPWALINACRKFDQKQPEKSNDVLEPWFARPDKNDHEVMMGIDFAEGRKGGDSTSVQVIEKDADSVLKQRYYADLDHKNGYDDFDRQLHEINRLIDIFRPQRVSVDETGLGRKIAADLKKVHGSVIEPITFHNANKEEMALNLKGLFEQQRLWLQYENKRIAGQIHNIKRKRTASGNLQYSGEPHDDMFWALALACKGNARRGGFRILTLDD